MVYPKYLFDEEMSNQEFEKKDITTQFENHKTDLKQSLEPKPEETVHKHPPMEQSPEQRRRTIADMQKYQFTNSLFVRNQTTNCLFVI